MVQTAHAALSLDSLDPGPRTVPPSHAPHHVPAMTPTPGLGVTALVTAARTWLPPD